jgi:hypothetical protein
VVNCIRTIKCRKNYNKSSSTGPIQIKTTKGRGYNVYKGYIAVFVCMATKAFHLEAVSDLSSIAFIAALKRFIARRGLCAHIYSDNGTNFEGADRILCEELNEAFKKANEEAAEVFSNQGISWHFIPPAAPHFRGLWEAGVKSVKHHLKRIIGKTTLTYEEMSTLLCQIEACLNSRPLCAVEIDPAEFETIAPGHFLIGSALLAPPGPNIGRDATKIRDRWILVQKLQQDFWKIWLKEYLSRLQERNKWKTEQRNLKIGDLVIINEKNTSPTYWPLVEEINKGNDNKVRVITIRTPNGTSIQRAIIEICPMSTEEEDAQMFDNSVN